MKSTRIGFIVFLTFLSVAISGCDQDIENNRMDAHFEGTWQVGYPLDRGTYWRIRLNGDRGDLTVISDGKPAPALAFNRSSEEEIEFSGVSRGIHVLGNGALNPRVFVDILRLVDPPKTLQLLEKGDLPTPPFATEGQSVVFLGGLIEGFPTVPMLGIEDGQRIELSFQPVDGDVDLEMGDFLARGAQDGATIGNFTALKPQRPQGSINSLSIAGHDIALESPTLRDGMLTTRDFGDLEVLVTGAGSGGGIRLQATLDQVMAIRAFLDSQE